MVMSEAQWGWMQTCGGKEVVLGSEGEEGQPAISQQGSDQILGFLEEHKIMVMSEVLEMLPVPMV